MAFGFVAGLTSAAQAGFTTVDISPYINGNLQIATYSYPVGVTTGNTGTGIPFHTYSYGSPGALGVAFLAGQSSPGSSSTLTINLSPFNISAQASFYALLNNYYGTPNVNEYNVVLGFSGGGTETFASIGGVDTRDYNQNPGATNSISATTTNWFNNGAGQRLDVRAFTIDTQFQTQQITSFTINQLVYNDPAFLSGITFSDQAASLDQGSSVPEPGALVLLVTGLAGLGLLRRQAR